MGRRGRSAKVQAVARKPSINSCSSREPSSSPERSLFQSSYRGSEVHSHAVTMLPSSSSQTAVGLSWVSMFKSSGKLPMIPAAPPTQQAVANPVSRNNRTSGTPSPSRQIANVLKSDIVEEVNFWDTSVVSYVTNVNPPLHVIDGFVRRVWKEQDIDKIGMVNRGVFLFRFKSKEDQELVCSMNGILFDKKPFIVKPWHPKISNEKSSITAVLVWVKLSKLALI